MTHAGQSSTAYDELLLRPPRRRGQCDESYTSASVEADQSNSYVIHHQHVGEVVTRWPAQPTHATSSRPTEADGCVPGRPGCDGRHEATASRRILPKGPARPTARTKVSSPRFPSSHGMTTAN